jgi:stage II sporulation protein D
MMRAALALALLAPVLFAGACSTRAPRRPVPSGGADPADGRDRVVRVALTAPDPRISGTREFEWFAADGRTLLSRGRRGELWRIEREPRGARVRAIRPDGVPTSYQRRLVVRVNPGGQVTANSRRYRGELTVLPLDDSLVVVNRLGLEEYLRGVVAVEMGNRPATDSAALQAQAVAARSFAVLRLGAQRPYDLRASVADQAYGGLDAENAGASAAVDATRGLVLRFRGRVVDAPYSSTCGGTTAEPQEVWRNPGAEYLRRVSDRIPGTDRHYCDLAPRFRWTREFDAAQLTEVLDRYLRAYASVPRTGAGRPRDVAVRARTASGRVGTLEVATERGTFPLVGNDIRYVLRAPGGEILPSTYFSVESTPGRDGLLERLTVRGQGHGHGVGMCQWGAIGRSRAGHSFRDILATYYPGTSVGTVQ